jgi:hypothetical protein
MFGCVLSCALAVCNFCFDETRFAIWVSTVTRFGKQMALESRRVSHEFGSSAGIFLSVAAFYFKSQVAYVHSVLVEAEVPWPINFPRLLLHTLFYYRQMLLEPIDSHGISHRHFSNR